ncbi:MAG: YmfQ family protein [Nitrososphaeria archaeon]|nr:YmfQ family protein [Nitrososphaeria archaeon]
MSSADKIFSRLPDFYKYWIKSSIIFKLVKAIGTELDYTKELAYNMMLSHWIETASDGDLDLMGSIFGLKRLEGEEDERYRSRIVRAIVDFTGGGTLHSIHSILKSIVGEGIQIIENPPADSSYEVSVMSGDTWTLGSYSIEEKTTPTLEIDASDRIENPSISNLDFNTYVNLKGVFEKGDKIVIKNGKCYINDVEANDKMETKTIFLHRKASTWKYSELIRERIGVFDSSYFDESIFAVSTPKATVRFKWTRLQPATIAVKIGREALNRSKYTKEYVKEVLDAIKAAGVKIIVEVD